MAFCDHQPEDLGKSVTLQVAMYAHVQPRDDDTAVLRDEDDLVRMPSNSPEAATDLLACRRIAKLAGQDGNAIGVASRHGTDDHRARVSPQGS